MKYIHLWPPACSIPIVFSLALLALLVFSNSSYADEPRLNQIQLIGTHNSYHIAPPPAIANIISLAGSGLARDIEYTHRPLPEQFEHQRVRHIELDIYADPNGGRFAKPFALQLARANSPDALAEFDKEGDLNQPGMKIIHATDFDFISTVPSLRAALIQIRTWSQRHPRHIPLMVLLELKERKITPISKQPLKFDRTQLMALEQEILQVLPRKSLLTPDDIRRDEPTMPAALKKHGWPRLGDIRGRIMFAMDNEGPVRDRYLKSNVNLKGRLLFTSVNENHPAAAFIKVNDPIGSFRRIQYLVRKGFLVRTRADANTTQSRRNDTTRRERAFASGAQFISTDYPEPNLKFSKYSVQFPGRVVARSNPLIGPTDWVSSQ